MTAPRWQIRPRLSLVASTHTRTSMSAWLSTSWAGCSAPSSSRHLRGYRSLLRWLGGFGQLGAVGVEGTGSWGAGLARFLTDAGVEGIEVNRPNRQARRKRGQSDHADAEAA